MPRNPNQPAPANAASARVTPPATSTVPSQSAFRASEGNGKKNHYKLRPDARVKLLAGFTYLLARRDEHFGNSRLIRNTFEMAIRRLANRLAKAAELDRKMLTTLEHADIAI